MIALFQPLTFFVIARRLMKKPLPLLYEVPDIGSSYLSLLFLVLYVPPN